MLIYVKAYVLHSACNNEIKNKGKESENSYRKLKSSRWTGTRTHTRKQNLNILTDTAILLSQKNIKYL